MKNKFICFLGMLGYLFSGCGGDYSTEPFESMCGDTILNVVTRPDGWLRDTYRFKASDENKCTLYFLSSTITGDYTHIRDVDSLVPPATEIIKKFYNQRRFLVICKGGEGSCKGEYRNYLSKGD